MKKGDYNELEEIIEIDNSENLRDLVRDDPSHYGIEIAPIEEPKAEKGVVNWLKSLVYNRINAEPWVSTRTKLKIYGAGLVVGLVAELAVGLPLSRTKGKEDAGRASYTREFGTTTAKFMGIYA